jgi:hypothetical protein
VHGLQRSLADSIHGAHVALLQEQLHHIPVDSLHHVLVHGLVYIMLARGGPLKSVVGIHVPLPYDNGGEIKSRIPSARMMVNQPL